MRFIVLSTLFALVAAPAMAASDAPGRYQILSVSGGFVRLDTVSGATTFCRDEVDSFRCSAIPIGPEKEPSKAETGASKDNLPNKGAASQDDAASKELDRNLDTALNFMERAMRGMMAITQEKTPECAL